VLRNGELKLKYGPGPDQRQSYQPARKFWTYRQLWSLGQENIKYSKKIFFLEILSHFARFISRDIDQYHFVFFLQYFSFLLRFFFSLFLSNGKGPRFFLGRMCPPFFLLSRFFLLFGCKVIARAIISISCDTGDVFGVQKSRETTLFSTLKFFFFIFFIFIPLYADLWGLSVSTHSFFLFLCWIIEMYNWDSQLSFFNFFRFFHIFSIFLCRERKNGVINILPRAEKNYDHQKSLHFRSTYLFRLNDRWTKHLSYIYGFFFTKFDKKGINNMYVKTLTYMLGQDGWTI